MPAVTETKLRTEDIKPKIGSRVLNSKEELLSGELAAQLRDLIEQRGVLVFPKIDFTEDEQIAFTKTLGNYAPENPDGSVSKITLDVKENPSAAEYLKGSLYWHIDGTRNDVPIFASLLTCKVLSPRGTGNTGFSNTYAAYDSLSDEQKAEYETLKVVHAPWASLFYYEPEPPLAKVKGMQAIGEKVLPLVWEHKSGRKSLVLGCTSLNVEGVSLAKSAEIIHGLREWATGPEFTYSHEWEAGDLVMWDNTGTMHRAEWYDPECGRMMLRTKLEGEEPWAE
ncbi:TauD/TfdA dioxygenase family protein [Novosphingobium album (ex Hu et al. 2023)]|uniref:TauD/TfdA family dioxygenase n=1 Tax=Novosphingobium album (ex Hu et al. 2023) TaxID=2930093 RepID=A0ABT0AWD7_9SPHN|nr:TauD/TfdA family dioxygenase [Novosphingobium album (ex Hu et al. 2023)]MCJ2177080.1 TauD/TfdA family dioxygenase [Novosphingobium album (ex Hu et al. 2023)]